jgi:hypothetical protein
MNFEWFAFAPKIQVKGRFGSVRGKSREKQFGWQEAVRGGGGKEGE